ncbi:hypothetical protein ACLBXM_07505 [Xanthobacteraceae bacterium A53D]
MTKDGGLDATLATDRPAQTPEAAGAGAERFRTHPRFKPILAAYCRTMARAAGNGWPIVKMLDQLARYMICYVLIHNYYAWRQGSGPAPTLSALQGAVSSSPRRTASVIAALKAGRLVWVEENPADRRARHLRPSPEVIIEIGRSGRAFVAAAEELGEGSAHRGRLLDENVDALGDLLSRSAAFVLAHGTLIHGFAHILHFARRDSGYPLLCAVMANHYHPALAEPADAISLAHRSLAHRLQISPAHVGNLLGEAADQGWFATDARGRLIHIGDRIVEEFEMWCAGQMAHYVGLADETHAAFSPPAPVAVQAKAGGV